MTIEVVREAWSEFPDALMEGPPRLDECMARFDAALASLEAELAEQRSVLLAVRNVCDFTGGEFWAGSNPEVWDRLVALTQEGAL